MPLWFSAIAWAAANKKVGTMDKVLIVDDSPQILSLMQKVGNRYKDEFELIAVNSGRKAMEVLKKTRVSLVITDLIMPQIDGLTLLTHINQLYPYTVCVAMTAYATESLIRILPDNLVAVLRKPFNVQELIDIIRKSLKTKPASGTMQGISIPSFLQLIEMDQKSCALRISLSDGRQGVFFFKEGDVYDAVFEDLTGKEAAIAMINIGEKPRFTLTPLPGTDIPRRINCRIMELLLLAAREKDVADRTGP